MTTEVLTDGKSLIEGVQSGILIVVYFPGNSLFPGMLSE